MNYKSAEAAAVWWRELQPYRADGTRNPNGDRGALARLRRATVTEAMCDPQAILLFRLLGLRHQRKLANAALCAGVLATVRENQRNVHPARALGPKSGGDETTAIMSPLRFRRLVETTDPEDVLIQMRRAVALAGKTINVRHLAAACLDWSEDTRRDWIFRYYDATTAAPDSELPITEELPA